jgi:identified by metaGeneAnnotator
LKVWFRNKSTNSKTLKEMAVFSTGSQRAIQDTHLIPFSALQHYSVCLHQCALIHNEQAWAENYLTAQEKSVV